METYFIHIANEFRYKTILFEEHPSVPELSLYVGA